MKVFRIEITGEIPDDNHELDAEAKVATRAPVQAIVEALAEMGLKNITQHRRTVRQQKADPKPVAPKLVTTDAA